MAPDGNAAPARAVLVRQSARGIGVVALAFSLVVGVQLAVDQMRAGQLRTVRSEDLGRTLAAAREAPANPQAVAFARELDRIARHAYFSSVAFRRTGIWMLAAGLLVGVGSLHLAWHVGRRFDDPRLFPHTDPLRTDRQSRLAVLVAGVAGLVALVVWSCVSAGQPASAAPPCAEMVMTSAALVLPRAATNQTAAAVAFMAAADTGAVAVAGGAAPDGSLTWSCFRGPLGGVAALRQAPVAWDGRTGAGVVWKTALAVPGLSSPVVWNDRVYLTEADEKARAVLGFDARDGRQVWRQGVADGGAGEALPETTSDTGLGAPSPACDASGVYAVFGTGDLAAFGRDGQRRWQVYLRRPAKPYGHASSLWAGNGLVCVQYDQEEDGRLLALDAANGRTVWEVPRGQGPSWSSPLVLPGSDGRPMLLVNGKGVADAYDLAKGTALWEVEGVTGDVAPSSASGDGRIYLVNGGSRLVCYTLAPAPVKAWEYADILPDVASPVAAQGLLFMATSSGGLVCLDAATGKELWHRDYEAGFYASPVVCGAALYALDRAGTMRVVAVERTFREIAACMLGEESDATPAFAGGRIYVRTKKRLWCLGR